MNESLTLSLSGGAIGLIRFVGRGQDDKVAEADDAPQLKLEKGDHVILVGGSTRVPLVRRFVAELQWGAMKVAVLGTFYDERGGKYPKNWADLGPRYNQ